MSVLYYDYTNGSDANNATSFALRKKTLASGSLGTAGDVLRVMQSSDPVSCGQNITLTNQSITTALASAVTQSLYLDGAWTASANVTASTDATNKKEGSNAASLAVAAAFTTGKIGYYATGTLDLSGYQQISFWIRSSAALAASVLRVDLCSDVAGATPVNSFTIDQALVANIYACFTYDNGSALGSSIKSIAITALSDPATPTILIDNVIACLAPSNSLCLTLNSLIGTNLDDRWLPIKSIVGTALIIDNNVNSFAGLGRGFWGVSGTYALYKRECINLTTATAATTVLQNYAGAAGTSGNVVTISGGWNTTDMSTQIGETWVDARNGAGNLFGAFTNRAFITTEKFFLVRGNSFATFNAGNDSHTVQDCGVVAGTASPAFNPISGMNDFTGQRLKSYNNGTIGIGTASNAANLGLTYTNVKSWSNGGNGFNSSIGTAFAQGYKEISDIECANNGGVNGFLLENPCAYINNIRCYDNATTANNAGLALTGQNSVAFNLMSSGHTTSNAGGILASGDSPRLINVTTVGNNKGLLAAGGTDFANYRMNVYNWTSSGDTTSAGFPTSNSNQGIIQSTFEAGATGSTLYSGYGTISTDPTVNHSGIFSWKFAPGSTTAATSSAPLSNQIGRFACKANETITIKYWARYSSANIVGQFRIVGGTFPGSTPGTDITTTLSGGADTWAQYTISATPTANCVIEVLFESYITSGSGLFCYVDGLVEVT